MDAIKATLHSYKSLATRKQLQITLEVPEEFAATALKMLGVADPSGVQWFALTRLNSSGVSREPDDSGPLPRASTSDTSTTVEPSPTATKGEETADKPVSFRDKPRSVQAALMCRKEEFSEWLHWVNGAIPNTLYNTDDLLKIVLGIHSKKELDTPGPKAEAWDKLLASYEYRGMVR